MEPLEVHLRPFDEADLWICERSVTDPDFAGQFEWVGFGAAQAYRRRWQEDRLLGRSPYTPTHRIWAGTEVDNVAEQRALEHCGFRREGLLRGHHFRDGAWRDSLIYGMTRDDHVARWRPE